MKRTILHIDMDAFFASVEQFDHPEYRGKPLIVGSPPEKRGVVSTCSYEARKYGVHSAMSAVKARKLCPNGIFVEPRNAHYSNVSKRVFKIFSEITPDIEQLSIDEAFLDITNVQKLHGTPLEIATKIKQRIKDETGLTASIGIAVNKTLAKLASEENKPDGIFIVPEDSDKIKEFLAPKPVSVLWGVGAKLTVELKKYGVATVKDLQNVSTEILTKWFSRKTADHLVAMSCGIDDRSISTSRREKSFSRERTFENDITDCVYLRELLVKFADDVGFRLRRSKYFATTGKIKIRWSDFSTISRQQKFEIPVNDAFSLRKMALKLFDEEQINHPVRLIGFGCSDLTVSNMPDDLFAMEMKQKLDKKEKATTAIDSIYEKLGRNPFI